MIIKLFWHDSLWCRTLVHWEVSVNSALSLYQGMNDQILRVMESWGNCSAVYIALEVDKWHKIGNKYQVELKRIKWSDTIKWAVDRELKGEWLWLYH